MRNRKESFQARLHSTFKMSLLLGDMTKWCIREKNSYQYVIQYVSRAHASPAP